MQAQSPEVVGLDDGHLEHDNCATGLRVVTGHPRRRGWSTACRARTPTRTSRLRRAWLRALGCRRQGRGGTLCTGDAYALPC